MTVCVWRTGHVTYGTIFPHRKCTQNRYFLGKLVINTPSKRNFVGVFVITRSISVYSYGKTKTTNSLFTLAKGRGQEGLRSGKPNRLCTCTRVYLEWKTHFLVFLFRNHLYKAMKMVFLVSHCKFNLYSVRFNIVCPIRKNKIMLNGSFIMQQSQIVPYFTS